MPGRVPRPFYWDLKYFWNLLISTWIWLKSLNLFCRESIWTILNAKSASISYWRGIKFLKIFLTGTVTWKLVFAGTWSPKGWETQWLVYIVDQGSTSSTFYEQLLCAQIPKVQKDSQVVSFFTLLGSVCAKAAERTLMKLTPRMEN